MREKVFQEMQTQSKKMRSSTVGGIKQNQSRE
jgi:hypothetical protein